MPREIFASYYLPELISENFMEGFLIKTFKKAFNFLFRKVHDRAKYCLLEGRVLENVLVWVRVVVGCGGR